MKLREEYIVVKRGCMEKAETIRKEITDTDRLRIERTRNHPQVAGSVLFETICQHGKTSASTTANQGEHSYLMPSKLLEEYCKPYLRRK